MVAAKHICIVIAALGAGGAKADAGALLHQELTDEPKVADNPAASSSAVSEQAMVEAPPAAPQVVEKAEESRWAKLSQWFRKAKKPVGGAGQEVIEDPAGEKSEESRLAKLRNWLWKEKKPIGGAIALAVLALAAAVLKQGSWLNPEALKEEKRIPKQMSSSDFHRLLENPRMSVLGF